MIPDVTIVASGSSIFEMRMSAKLAAEEKLTIWGFRRRYLRETQMTPGTRPHFATLGAEAVSRLSIAGVESLAPDGRAHDRLAHGPRVEDLEPRARAGTDGRHQQTVPVVVGRHVRSGAA